MYKMIVFDCVGTLLDSSAMIAMIQKGYSSMFPQRKKQPYAFFIPCYYIIANCVSMNASTRQRRQNRCVHYNMTLPLK